MNEQNEFENRKFDCASGEIRVAAKKYNCDELEFRKDKNKVILSFIDIN